ncbi:MAG: alternative oxidase [Rhodobacterales bacterium]|nr:alternative oxidase [Rhodobacterales bacterium]
MLNTNEDNFVSNESTGAEIHTPPQSFSDSFALFITKALRFFADTLFKKRYGHRAVVLETVAGVPGMVAGVVHHLRSLRKMKDDDGMIKELLDEAENERMHLMTFIEIAKPSKLERFLILLAQISFGLFYTLLYIFFKKTAHRMIGYFEEEAVTSYTEYLNEIDNGTIMNRPAPKIAIDYWNLGSDASLRDVVVAVRADEAGHRDKNHDFADKI